MKKHNNYLRNKILNLRKQIDFIDSAILNLINVRLYLVENIGQLKREGCRSIVDDIRETQILSRLKASNKGLLESRFLYDIFSGIIAASRTMQMKRQTHFISYEIESRSPIDLFKIKAPISAFNSPNLVAIYSCSLVFVNTTIKVDCSYFFVFLLTSKTWIYTGYHSQTKYGLIISISNSGVVYIYVDSTTRHYNCSQRCIF